MNNDETLVDLKATVDYIRDRVTEHADEFDFDDGVAMHDALSHVIEEARRAQSLIDTALMTHLEAGARQIGTRLFVRKRNVVQRFKHDSIRAAVSRWARREATDEDGVTSVARAVDHAVMAMADLYVAPSTKAKVTRFDSYEVNHSEVMTSKDKGWKLEIQELDERQP